MMNRTSTMVSTVWSTTPDPSDRVAADLVPLHSSITSSFHHSPKAPHA